MVNTKTPKPGDAVRRVDGYAGLVRFDVLGYVWKDDALCLVVEGGGLPVGVHPASWFVLAD